MKIVNLLVIKWGFIFIIKRNVELKSVENYPNSTIENSWLNRINLTNSYEILSPPMIINESIKENN